LAYLSLSLSALAAVSICLTETCRTARDTPEIAAALRDHPDRLTAAFLGRSAVMPEGALCCSDAATNPPTATNQMRGRS
jgi:hypothetical protein